MGELNVPSGYTYIGVLAVENGYGDQFACTYSRYGSSIYVVVKNYYSGGTLTSTVKCNAVFLKNS